VLGIAPCVLLLILYLVVTTVGVRRSERPGEEEEEHGTWRLRTAVVALTVSTVLTALVSELLVHSLEDFARAAHLSEFFIAIVIVAIVGNAAEHGGAVVIARRGNTELATEIAITSSMQVAVFVAPAVALLSWLVGKGLPLSFRVVEVVTMAAAAAFATLVVWDGRSRRWEGFLLVGVYGLCVVWYALA
jgi:Ca2+:H+ antiporter